MLSRCFLGFSMNVGVFDIGLSQTSSFSASCQAVLSAIFNAWVFALYTLLTSYIVK